MNIHSAIAIVALMLSGCVTTRGVTSRTAATQQLRRFAFYPSDDRDHDELSRSPVGQAMRQEVARHLSARGLFATDEQPDFWVDCYFIVEQHDSAPYASPLTPLYLAAPGTTQYLRSTVVVDFINPVTREVFWRGTARTMVPNPENPDPRRIAAIVDRLLDQRLATLNPQLPHETRQARRQ
jgi:hypothetical protein